MVALLMGVAQAFALVPGISRSGATVVTGLWAGVEVREAAAFSFLMAIPAIAGAAVLKLPEVVGGGPIPGGSAMAVGSVVAGITGIAAIRIFVAMLRSGSFHRFGVYCWVVGAAFLLFLGLR
jgi:undecaprenyl-diphosphatase